MQKLVVAIATFATIVARASALAADLPVKAPPPPPAAVHSWTGWYVGLNAGYAWSDHTSTDVVGTPNFASGLNGAPQGLAGAVAGATTSIPVGNAGGFIGGGQVGYNYQFKNVVAGLEADIQGLFGIGSGATANTVPFPGFPPLVINTSITGAKSVDWLGTVRGRLGVTITPTILAYATGGLAFGGVSPNINFTQQVTGSPNCTVCVPYGFRSTGETRTGYALGAGVESIITSQWTGRVEYLHYDLGTVSSIGAATNIAQPPAPNVPYYTVGTTASTRFSGDIVRVGLNHQFQ
jgi:outer membrane immunogenic protein